MMGDNRDNSRDSRTTSVGVVPAENMVGRADRLFFSHNGNARIWEVWKWPLPDFPDSGIAIMAEKQTIGSTNHIFSRHNPNGGCTAVARIVTIIAHHEIMSFRHLINGRVVIGIAI